MSRPATTSRHKVVCRNERKEWCETDNRMSLYGYGKIRRQKAGAIDTSPETATMPFTRCMARCMADDCTWPSRRTKEWVVSRNVVIFGWCPPFSDRRRYLLPVTAAPQARSTETSSLANTNRSREKNQPSHARRSCTVKRGSISSRSRATGDILAAAKSRRVFQGRRASKIHRD